MTSVRTVLRVTLALATLLGVFWAGWWAGKVALGTRPIVDDIPTLTLAEAREGSVGRVFNFGVTVKIPEAPVAVNQLTGVVTEVGEASPANGDLLFVVGDQPVVAVVAERPFFRDLESGVKGADVRALQQMLIENDLLSGTADGVFGPVTERALKAFQREVGVAQSGRAPLGTLYAFPSLPISVAFADPVRLGAYLSGGEELVSAPVGEREFTVSVAESQQEFIPAGAVVEFSHGGVDFVALVSEDREVSVDTGQITAYLTGVDGQTVCGGACDTLPTQPTTSLLAQVRPEPEVSGIVLPGAAVMTAADGSAFVERQDGSRVDVIVKGSGQGLVVVEGIEVGEMVRLSAGQDGSAEAPEAGSTATEGSTRELD